MAVTEALMLGLFVVATRYSSAEEQIKDGENGLILENTDKAILKFLADLHNNCDWLLNKRKEMCQHDYSNTREYLKVEQLIDN